MVFDLTYNQAAQVKDRSISKAAYAYSPAASLNDIYYPDHLNRYSGAAGKAFSYDGRQNLTSDGVNTYAYDIENRLISVSGASNMTLDYDPLGRLRETISGGVSTDFVHDGDSLVMEYQGASVASQDTKTESSRRRRCCVRG